MLSPIGVRGSRLAYGSWKMICIRRRYGLSAAPLSAVMSVAVEPDRAGRRLDEAQEQPADRRLAAARLADQAERLAAPDRRSSTPSTAWTIADRPLEDAAPDREVLDEVADLDERLPAVGARRRVRRRPATPAAVAGDARVAGGSTVATALGDRARHRRSCRRTVSGRGDRPAVLDVVVEPAADVVARGRPARSSGWTSSRQDRRPRSIRVSAARREPAAVRQVDQVRDVARDDRQLVAGRRRRPGSSRSGRGCTGAAARGRASSTSVCSTISPAYMTATRSHISATTPRSWVMRMIAVPVSLAEVAHQVEDLGLDRDVEGGRRLVGDEQLRLAGEGHRDHHPLGHAARHLVREGLEAPLRVRDADHPQQLEGAVAGGLAASSCGGARGPRRSAQPTSQTGFSDEVGCWKIIEIRSPRILRISLARELQQVRAVEQDLAGLDPARRPTRPHDRQAGHALAAAGLADEAHDLAAVDVEVDAVDGPDDAVAGVERRPQALDLEERPVRRAAGRGRRADGRDELLDDRLVEVGPSVGAEACSVGIGSVTG